MLGSWQGPASAGYAGTCLSQSEALSQQGDGWVLAAGAAMVFADELEQARRHARDAIDDAKQAKARIKRAKVEIAGAKERLADAELRVGAARLELSVGLVGPAGPGAHDALRRAQHDADEAERDFRHWRREYQHAQDELEQAQRRGKRANQEAEDAASTARSVFAGIGGQMPGLVLTAAPARPQARPDKPWWEDAADWTGDRIAGLGRGAGEGFKGLGEAGVMLYRLSNLNGVIDPAGQRREQKKLAAAGVFAWQNPGEFGKALVNWDDLASGRYDEWIGNLAPDALAALATGGAGAAISRGSKGAKAAEDLAKTAERLNEGRRAYDRASAAKSTLPKREEFKKKTTASNGHPTLSGWRHQPEGYRNGAPEEVKKLADEIGHEFKPHPFDQLDKSNGFEGKFNASHAEKQQALTSPGSDIAVTRPMCHDCVGFHRRLAEHTGKPQLVTDPDITRLFLPDGTVVKSPGLDDFPALQDPSSFDGRAAVAGGAGAHGLNATKHDGGR